MAMTEVATQVIAWLLLAAIFIVLEIISLGLTTIWFAGGSFIAAIAGACGASLAVQIILFLVVSVVLLVLTRPLAVKHLNSKTERTNSEALVGQTAIVLKDISNLKEEGQVKINGMEWTARTKDNTDVIPAGSQVVIVEIQGVKLIVEKAEENNSTANEEE